MICHLEWDLLVGPMGSPMLILMLVSPILFGHGGEAGEVVGVAAGAGGSAGAGICHTGTGPIGTPGGKNHE